MKHSKWVLFIFLSCYRLSAMQYVNGFDAALLFQGARSGLLNAVQSVLDDGVPVDLIDEDYRTPLIYALVNGHFYTALYLLKQGANPSVRDEKGRTTLELLLRTPPRKEEDMQVISEIARILFSRKPYLFYQDKDLFVELARQKNYSAVEDLLLSLFEDCA